MKKLISVFTLISISFAFYSCEELFDNTKDWREEIAGTYSYTGDFLNVDNCSPDDSKSFTGTAKAIISETSDRIEFILDEITSVSFHCTKKTEIGDIIVMEITSDKLIIKGNSYQNASYKTIPYEYYEYEGKKYSTYYNKKDKTFFIAQYFESSMSFCPYAFVYQLSKI